MLIISYFAIQLINIFNIFFKIKSKIVEKLNLSLIFVLLAGNTSTLDTYNYIISYNKALLVDYSSELEKGYLFLEKIGNFIGLDYQWFRIILVCIALYLIHTSLKRITQNVSYVYFFYMVSTVFIDSVQFRNFFAFSIIIYGIRFLIEVDKRSAFKYVACVLIATSIHTTAIVYIILLLAQRGASAFVKTLPIFVGDLCLIVFLNDNSMPFIGNILQFFNLQENKIGYIYSNTNLGFLYPFVAIILTMSLIYIEYHRYSRLNLVTKDENQYVEGLWLITLISTIFLIFYMLNLNFTRFGRNLFIMQLTIFAIVQSTYRVGKFDMHILNIFVFINSIYLFYYIHIVGNNFETTVLPLFIDNFFI